MTYAGDRPFTGGELSRIERRKDQPGPWTGWTATESWAALVNDAGFGLGVWSPHCCDFNGGFAGIPGKGGPYDDPTGYIAPSPQRNHRLEHRPRLLLRPDWPGDLRAIRKYVYDHAARPVPPSYRFEKDRQGWYFVNASDTGWPIRGELNVLLTQADPQLHGPVGFWQAAGCQGILAIRAAGLLRMAATPTPSFWKNLGDEHFSENKSLGFTLTSDGEYHIYRIKLTDSRAWRGPMVQLRFDPVATGGKGEWIRH